MCPLSDRTSSISGSESESKNRYFDPVDSFDSTAEDLKNQNIKLIKAVNQKYPLINVLKKYRVDLKKVTDIGDWTHHARCPFPDHRDSNPSFGYNSKEDRFYCFGCRRSGRSVEFISQIESLPKVSVARDILIELKISEEDIKSNDLLSELDHGEEINNILIDFSIFINNLFTKYKNNIELIKFISDTIFTIDMYLYHSVPKNRINPIELNARIEKCKDIFDSLEKNE